MTPESSKNEIILETLIKPLKLKRSYRVGDPRVEILNHLTNEDVSEDFVYNLQFLIDYTYIDEIRPYNKYLILKYKPQLMFNIIDDRNFYLFEDSLKYFNKEEIFDLFKITIISTNCTMYKFMSYIYNNFNINRIILMNEVLQYEKMHVIHKDLSYISTLDNHIIPYILQWIIY